MAACQKVNIFKTESQSESVTDISSDDMNEEKSGIFKSRNILKTNFLAFSGSTFRAKSIAEGKRANIAKNPGISREEKRRAAAIFQDQISKHEKLLRFDPEQFTSELSNLLQAFP
ncbi:hypothetical protein [Heyndrickxia coagulans]|uniref:hypothetical protein n=1 Tax=Heyndrickxia coagulans TaxID=1398 RepID=UPI0015C6236E|nr:hypothetical protein [Heyndrickxia coagulans]